MSRSWLLRSFHIFNHAAVAYGLIHYSSVTWILASAFIYFFIGSFGISIGYHRYLSHKSLQPKEGFKYFCLFWGMVSTGGSPLSWAAAHRVHHQHTDTEKDIHSVRRDGVLRVYFHFWQAFAVNRKLVRDLIKDRVISYLHHRYFIILFLYAATLYSIDLKIGIFIYSMPAVLAFHFYGLINVLGHSKGSRQIETPDDSTNNWFVNIFTFGEGWHQNHHLLPASYRIGLRAKEWDISAWIIEKLPVVQNKEKLFRSSKSAIDTLNDQEKKHKALGAAI